MPTGNGDIDQNFNFFMASGSVVYGIVPDPASGDIAVAGQPGYYANVGGGGAYLLARRSRNGGTSMFDVFGRRPAGFGAAVGRSVMLHDDDLIVGGNFHDIWVHGWLDQRGAVAFSEPGFRINWNPNLLDTGNADEEARTLLVGSGPTPAYPNGALWIGGRYTKPSKSHIAAFPLP